MHGSFFFPTTLVEMSILWLVPLARIYTQCSSNDRTQIKQKLIRSYLLGPIIVSLSAGAGFVCGTTRFFFSMVWEFTQCTSFTVSVKFH